MAIRKVVAANAALEVATGVALMAVPGFAVHLLSGTDLSGVAIAVSRLAGVALLSLGLACWPNRDDATPQAIWTLFTYNLLVALYLSYLWLGAGFDGYLLWPACALHTLLAILLAAPAYEKVRQAFGSQRVDSISPLSRSSRQDSERKSA